MRSASAIGSAKILSVLPVLTFVALASTGCTDTRKLQAEQQRLQARVDVLEQERDQQKTRVAEYQNMLDARAQEADAYQQQLQDLLDTWTLADARHRQTEQQLTAIREQVSHLTGQLVRTQNALTDATTRAATRAATQASDTDATTEKLKLLQVALDTATKQHTDDQQKIASLQKELDELHNAMQKMPIAPFASQPPVK